MLKVWAGIMWGREGEECKEGCACSKGVGSFNLSAEFRGSRCLCKSGSAGTRFRYLDVLKG